MEGYAKDTVFEVKKAVQQIYPGLHLVKEMP